MITQTIAPYITVRNGCLLLLLLPVIVVPVMAVDYTVNYNPETGVFTKYWFDPTASPNPYYMIYSFLLPFTNLLGPSVYFLFWAAPIVGIYIYTQDITMPWVVGVLTGALLSNALAGLPEGLMMMILTMAFAAGGILAKVMFGK